MARLLFWASARSCAVQGGRTTIRRMDIAYPVAGFAVGALAGTHRHGRRLGHDAPADPGFRRGAGNGGRHGPPVRRRHQVGRRQRPRLARQCRVARGGAPGRGLDAGRAGDGVADQAPAAAFARAGTRHHRGHRRRAADRRRGSAVQPHGRPPRQQIHGATPLPRQAGAHGSAGLDAGCARVADLGRRGRGWHRGPAPPLSATASRAAGGLPISRTPCR